MLLFAFAVLNILLLILNCWFYLCAIRKKRRPPIHQDLSARMEVGRIFGPMGRQENLRSQSRDWRVYDGGKK